VCQDEAKNKISFISKELSEYLFTDSKQHKLNILHLGVPIFTRNLSQIEGSECNFTINQEGVINLVPYMTKRIVRTQNLVIFKRLISKRYNGSQSSVKEDK
jgi:agmatine/peptidylarginine deiminase